MVAEAPPPTQRKEDKNMMIGDRIAKLEKFFGVKKPKNMNPLEWLDELYEMEQAWEEEHQMPFPV
jgi:hypothetical protein